MIYQMADIAMNPRQTVGTIIGRPLEFYFGMSGGAKNAPACRNCWTRSKWVRAISTAIPPSCRAGRNSVSASPARWPPNPRLIICDEVTSALDPLVADGILKLLLNLQARENVAYLFITHDLATVRAIADRIAVMYQGKVVRYGTKTECAGAAV